MRTVEAVTECGVTGGDVLDCRLEIFFNSGVICRWNKTAKGNYMKRILLKSVSAMGLAAALSAAALAGTVQAAGGAERAVCRHEFTAVTYDIRYEIINSDSHAHYVQTAIVCEICYYVQDEGDEHFYIEAHDLRAAEWPLRYRCADCGYEE